MKFDAQNVRHTGTPLNLLDRIARKAIVRRLGTIHSGSIVLQDGDSEASFGESGNLQAICQVNNARFFRKALLGGTNSIAESYINGDWECDDLTTLFRIFVRNLEAADRLDLGLTRVFGIGHRLYHWLHRNDRSGSLRNIRAHYDLGNDFFRLWLDETLAYSCGIFPTPQSTLKAASIEKFERVCRLLELQPDDKVIEIGSGWGGFSIYAARKYGCKLTTTTISREQYEFALAKVHAAKLTNQISLLQQDYRDLRGSYNKLVSIEMIEAVGHQYFDAYFKKCCGLLRPDGSMVLQAIVIPDRRYETHLRSVDFMQRFIFPGGCLPSVAAILSSVSSHTDFRLVHLEDYGPHYAETLRRWKRAFHSQRKEVLQLGFSEEFIRLWNYYLCYCEAAFEERQIGLVQMQFDKPQHRRSEMHHEIRNVYRKADLPCMPCATVG